MTQHIELDLSSDSLQEVQEAVNDGEYASPSEVIDKALREWRVQRAIDTIGVEAIRKALDEAMEDDSPGEDPQVVFARLMEEFRDPSDTTS